MSVSFYLLLGFKIRFMLLKIMLNVVIENLLIMSVLVWILVITSRHLLLLEFMIE